MVPRSVAGVVRFGILLIGSLLWHINVMSEKSICVMSACFSRDYMEASLLASKPIFII